MSRPPALVTDLPLELLRLSLSQRQAKRRLMDGVTERLQHERSPRILGELLFRIIEPDTAAAAALGALLVIAAAARLASLWDAALGGVLLTLALGNAWITSRESRLSAGELPARMHAWLRLISRDHHIHRGAVDGPATVSVMRDGVWLRLHRNLCVEGDVIKLRAGEAAPGRCAQPFHLAALCGVERQTLAPGEAFVPELTAGAIGASSSVTDDVRSAFVLSETIAVRQLDDALRCSRRPPPPLVVQLSSASRLLLWGVLVSWAQAALLQALGWWFALASGDARRPTTWVQLRAWLGAFLLPHLASLALPLLPLALPAFVAVANALGAAYLITTLTGMPVRPTRPAIPASSSGRRRLLRGDPSGWRGEGVPGLVGAEADSRDSWLGSSWLGRSLWRASGYWDASGYYDTEAPSTPRAGGQTRIARRGPERLFSDGAPDVVPGSRFARYAGTRLSREQWAHVIRLAWRVLRGEPQAGQLRPSRLLSALGSVTVLACPDKRGVLSDGTPSVKQARGHPRQRQPRAPATEPRHLAPPLSLPPPSAAARLLPSGPLGRTEADDTGHVEASRLPLPHAL